MYFTKNEEENIHFCILVKVCVDIVLRGFRFKVIELLAPFETTHSIF